MPKKILRLAAVLGLSLGVLGASGLPGPTCLAADEIEMPEVSVTATRTEREMEKLARNVTVITREEIEALNPLTVADVLKTVPGLVVRDYTGTGALASVDMRGFGETGNLHTLVMLDDRRLNQIDLTGVDFTTIPVENIERIEILHGPAGVLYGDSAVGGVINIISKEGSGNLSGTLRGQYGSYNLWGAQGYLQGGAEKVSYFVSARHAYTDGYRDHSATRLTNASFNTRYYATDTLSFLLDGGYNVASYLLPGSLSEAQMDDDRRQRGSGSGWAENREGAARGQMRNDFGRYGVLTMDASYRGRSAQSEIYDERDTDINTVGLTPKYVLDGKLGQVGHRLTVGLDYYYIHMKTDVTGGWFPGSTTYDLNSVGGYLLEEVSLIPQLILTLGGRLHWSDYAIENSPSGSASTSQNYDDTQYAWTAGLAYNFAPGSKVYGRVSRTFRYPTVEEYVTYGVFCDLKPEKAMNYEVGGEYAFMPGGRVSLAAYLLQMEDEIAYNPATYMNENLDETRHMGLEGGLRVPLWDRAHFFGSLTWQRAVFTSGSYDGKRLPLVPDWKATAGVSVEIIKNLRGRVQGNYVGDRPFGSDKENEYGTLDPYFTLDAHLDYCWKMFKFFLNASNILGAKYCTYAYAGSYGRSYYPDPQTVIWGGVQIGF